MNRSNKFKNINSDQIDEDLKKCNSETIERIFKQECSAYGISYVPAIMPKVPRIVVFGDIHGDYDLTIDMFSIAGLIDSNTDWCGGSTYVVQVGDQIDRCRYVPNKNKCTDQNTTLSDEHSDIAILEFFTKLDRQSRRTGGMVISLLGNHELMNATGYMDYVSREGIEGFKNYKDTKTGKVYEDGKEGRIHAFKPGNQYGKFLGCTRYPAVIIGSNIFVHAGIIDGLITDLQMTGPSDLEDINIKLRMWLMGHINEACISHIIDSRPDSNSMFWTRILGTIPPGVPLSSEVCHSNISKALEIFQIRSDSKSDKTESDEHKSERKLKRNSKGKSKSKSKNKRKLNRENNTDSLPVMIIGHTPQSFIHSNDLNSTCGSKVWRVDNGASKAFDMFDNEFRRTNGVKDVRRRTQYLEIINDNDYYVCDAKGRKRAN